jgi:hypothetical protein
MSGLLWLNAYDLADNQYLNYRELKAAHYQNHEWFARKAEKDFPVIPMN